jgi:CheY-like chemotaxis protein
MSIKILLADDSITIQKVIGIIFGGEEYTLTVVDNGKAALDRALETAPDILLIDALMPGMSGYEVCERIRATPELAAKPILLLTGSFEPFDETRARQCGADDFIAKPFESQQIIGKVTELCERSALRSFEATAAPHQETMAPPLETPQESVLPANNIWDAFTAPTEPAPETVVPPLADQEQNPFAPQEAEPAPSPWVPIDEQSFQFEEETAADVVTTTYGEPSSVNEFSFADTSFAEPPAAVGAPPLPVMEPVIPAETPAVSTAGPAPAETPPPQPASPAAAVTEEQLRAAIASVSRDVIERIVWEVVPDLAETMIREAIQRIREGVR